MMHPSIYLIFLTIIVMKPFHIIAIAIITIIHIHCAHTRSITRRQPVNYEEKDSNGNIKLLGKSTRERLMQPPFDSWFIKNYDSYTIDTSTANRLKPLLANKQFLIFMGTWCGDSRREVPRIYKLLDYCGVPAGNIQLVNVNNADSAYKQSPQHEEKGWNIHRVPDLLIVEKKHELGRVVESPVTSWENDILAIVSRQAYAPKYKAVSYMLGVWEQQSLSSVQNNLHTIADSLTTLVANRDELLSYGKTLLARHETDKAILVMQLNTLLFAADAEVWNGLAYAWQKKGAISTAITCCNKALELQPGNATATTLLQQLKTP